MNRGAVKLMALGIDREAGAPPQYLGIRSEPPTRTSADRGSVLEFPCPCLLRCLYSSLCCMCVYINSARSGSITLEIQTTYHLSTISVRGVVFDMR